MNQNKILEQFHYFNIQADVSALMTEWFQFHMPSWNVIKKVMTGNVKVDGRNIYDLQELGKHGFVYTRIGKKVQQRRDELKFFTSCIDFYLKKVILNWRCLKLWFYTK